ncbi:hypothetical protein OQA88_3313 [Cercophora sp. LCS_1]
MLFSPAVIAALWASATVASPLPRSEDKCVTKLQRRAWHTFSNDEKKAYIAADLCLMNKPATLGLPGAKNRYEELQAIHQIQAAITHNVGAFLHYHRLHMFAHERAIREECGFQGAQPYWDEPRDAGKFSTSDVLDPIVGFGGNGVGTRGCIVDGPFANYTNNLGPGYFTGPHCINRFVNDTVSLMSSQSYVDACLEKETFVEFWPCLEGAPHSGGHGGVGGKMLDPIASPGDPIFYLHHTWLDKLFWGWQSRGLPARLSEIGGVNQASGFAGFPPLPGGGGNGSAPPVVPAPPGDGGNGTGLPFFPPGSGSFPPFESMIPPADAPGPEGDPGNVTTLSHVLNMYGVIPNATIVDVMDISGGLLCYEYV